MSLNLADSTGWPGNRVPYQFGLVIGLRNIFELLRPNLRRQVLRFN